MNKFPDTKNIRELLAITRPEIGWPQVAMDALVDITKICDILEGQGYLQPQPRVEGAIERMAELLWSIDYPDGGSMYKTYDSTQFHDKELYRKEARQIIEFHRNGKPLEPQSGDDAKAIHALKVMPKLCAYHDEYGENFDFEKYQKDMAAWSILASAALPAPLTPKLSDLIAEVAEGMKKPMPKVMKA